MNTIFIDILAFITLLSSLLVITSKNPVISVVYLISVFTNAAGYLILTGITFIGISYIVIYIGAITVLFLFVIMLLNIQLEEILEYGSGYTKNISLALFIAFSFIYEMFNIVPFIIVNILSTFSNFWNNINSILILNSDINSVFFKVQLTINPNLTDSYIINFTQIEALGHVLYTYSAVLLIITSIILLLSMIGPIFLHVRTSI